MSRRRILQAGAAAIFSRGSEAFSLGSQQGVVGARVHILHINDMHSRLEHTAPTRGGRPGRPLADIRRIGGAARLATAVRQRRAEKLAEGVPVLTFDVGDQSQGTLFYTTYGGKAEVEMMNLIGFDAMTLGNHEFNRGSDALAKMLATANFPVVSGNTRIAPGHPLGDIVRDRLVIEAGGVRVGVLGVTTPETAVLSSPGDAVAFADPVTHLNEAVARLRAEGVRNIIVLSHLGLFHDRLLASVIDGISLIVGGHSHTFMSNVEPGAPRYATLVESRSGRPTPIVQAYAYGRYLGDLTVDFDEDGAVIWASGEPIELTSEAFIEAPDLAERVAALAKPIAKLRETPVAVLAASIDASRDNCRTRECEMGNTVAEAMLARVAASGVTIAIANGGGMRASLAAGEVTLDDIFGVLPFQNTLFTMELTGAQITAALEQGVSRFEIRTGSFPQVAGLRVRFNPLAFAGRSRITEVNVRTQDEWAPIEPAASYSVVVSNFMAAGGDGYSALTEGRNRYDTAIDMADALAEFLFANAPYAPHLDGRIAR